MKEITGHTQLTGLLGSPVSHSISPMMHNAAFQYLNLDCVYLAFDVDSHGLPDAVKGLKILGVRGFNLTMPNKNEMADLADELSPAARLCHSVNTVVNHNGRLIGHTTDGIGYIRAAKEAGVSIPGSCLTILGAGGAATSIIVQAALDGAGAIHIFNRKGPNFERAQDLAQTLYKETGCPITVTDLADETTMGEKLLKSQLLVNTTNVGMAPNTEGCLIRDPNILHPGLTVSDIIYNPRTTKLMALAQSRGLKTFNGLYMLLYQGAEAFRLWTGAQMPVDYIKKLFSPM